MASWRLCVTLVCVGALGGAVQHGRSMSVQKEAVARKATIAMALPVQQQLDAGTTPTDPDLPNAIAIDVNPANEWSPHDEQSQEDPNAVDHRFRLSASVIRACKHPSNNTCEDEIPLLREFLREPRDVRWARETETHLRALISQLSPPQRLRSLECRSTICALEVASIYGHYDGRLADPWLDKSLFHYSGYHGYETDDRGIRTTVSVRTYQRRSGR